MQPRHERLKVGTLARQFPIVHDPVERVAVDRRSQLQVLGEEMPRGEATASLVSCDRQVWARFRERAVQLPSERLYLQPSCLEASPR